MRPKLNVAERKTCAHLGWAWFGSAPSWHLSCSLVTLKYVLWAHRDTLVPWTCCLLSLESLKFFLLFTWATSLHPLNSTQRDDFFCLCSFSSLMLAWVISGLFGGDIPGSLYGGMAQSCVPASGGCQCLFVGDGLNTRCWRLFTRYPSGAMSDLRHGRV